MVKLTVEFYARKDCSQCSFAREMNCTLCAEAREIISRVNAEVPFVCKEIDICSSQDLLRRFKDAIPTVYINGQKAFKYKVDEAEFRKKVRKELIKDGLRKLWTKKQQYS